MDMTTRHLISDAANAFLAAPKRMLIGADWVEAADGAQLDVRNPATGETFARVPAGKAADVDRAVRAARAAFEDGPWPALSPAQRERLLLALADRVEANAQELAEIESLDNGKSLLLARHVDMAMAVDFLRYMAGWATKIEGATHDVSVPFMPQARFFAWTRREPVGVVGAIIPWNFPLLMAAWKIGPALAAGCTVVLKPAEETPLTALRLGELILEAGIPPGVVNIVTGLGETAGAALAGHPGVAKIAFTGSTAVGKLVQRAAIDNMTRVSLELGGKSPVIVLDDADPAQAAAGAAQAIFFNQGQVCTAGSRLYVQRKLFDQVVGELAGIASRMKLGPGLDPASELGPLVSEAQRDRVCGYIDGGVAQGARVAAGGGRAGEPGYFVQPTVLVDAAHNPAGAEVLARAITESFTFARLVGVIAVMKDKDALGLLQALEPVLDDVVVTRTTSPRAMTPRQLGELAAEVFGEQRVTVVEELPDALDVAAGMADADGGVSGGVLATGSVVTAAEVRMLLGTTGV